MPPESTRPGTPPHHPIFGVTLSRSHIEAIFAALYPQSELLSVSQLESGKSFNNRIYFLSLGQSCGSLTTPKETRELLLKVNGRFFGSDKIQNEVACLRILEQYCPELPVPRVIAWSEDGRTITIPSWDDNYATHKKLPIPLEDESAQHPGWILMTRLPGEAVSSLTLDDTAMSSIGAQLAEMVAAWRLNVPHTNNCGNLLFYPSDIVGPSNIDIDLGHEDARPAGVADAFIVRGLLGDGIPPSKPITSVLELHRIRFQAKLHELQTVSTFAPNRELVPEISNFITTSLTKLFPIPEASDSFVFTHFDLSPRNTLVTIPTGTTPDAEGKPTTPQITGLIDFEFSGFFPPSHEFVNDYVDNGGDWSEAAYAAYLKRLAELEVATPLDGIDGEEWRVEHRLGVLMDNIAPWWLPGGFTEREVGEKLEECRRVDMVKALFDALDA
ncbi:hypothetical protein B0T16DRAFT_429666 [Cercophora newfieldiana]|uniref:Aminoglycoside phosphotransferase domain-containing protein n=1 Tax=Cercophora newfieldiana TaxID=92897 RepID=A0AA40CQ12_9PEZI|nr:hypothetical protein B0T16DRAFT_429666 [Cercophora newfieldiana]